MPACIFGFAAVVVNEEKRASSFIHTYSRVISLLYLIGLHASLERVTAG